MKPTKPLTPSEMSFVTAMSRRKMEAAVKLAAEMSADPKAALRKAEQICIPCYYITRIAGAAMTRSQCALCDTEIMNNSTDVNKVCLSCAQAHQLCVHCGGDFHLDPRRSAWPEKRDAVKPDSGSPGATSSPAAALVVGDALPGAAPATPASPPSSPVSCDPSPMPSFSGSFDGGSCGGG